MPNSRMDEGLKYRLALVDEAGEQKILTVQNPKTIKNLKVGDRVVGTQLFNSVKVTKKDGWVTGEGT